MSHLRAMGLSGIYGSEVLRAMGDQASPATRRPTGVDKLHAWEASAPNREITIAHRPGVIEGSEFFACALERRPGTMAAPWPCYGSAFGATRDEAAELALKRAERNRERGGFNGRFSEPGLVEREVG